MLKLSDLNPRTNYCVVRDPENRESIVTRGDEIQRTWRRNRDYYHYAPTQAPWHDYLRLDCGDGIVLAVWRDPTRPELNSVDDAGLPMTVDEPAAEPTAESVTKPVADPVTKPVAEPVTKSAAKLVVEPAADQPVGWTQGLAEVLAAMQRAAGEVVSTFYHHG